jgi:predicted transcriptional regulator
LREKILKINDELRLKRLRLRVSQFQLARLTGIQAYTISKFENSWIEFPEDKIRKIKLALESLESGREQ